MFCKKTILASDLNKFFISEHFIDQKKKAFGFQIYHTTIIYIYLPYIFIKLSYNSYLFLKCIFEWRHFVNISIEYI